MNITGPWPDRGNIIIEDFAITIPFNHLRLSVVEDLLDYVTKLGDLELHNALTEVAIELGDD